MSSASAQARGTALLVGGTAFRASLYPLLRQGDLALEEMSDAKEVLARLEREPSPLLVAACAEEAGGPLAHALFRKEAPPPLLLIEHRSGAASGLPPDADLLVLPASSGETVLRRAVSLLLSQAELRAENRRLARRLGLARRMEALGALAGGIAHDFNNALSPIIGFAELVAARLTPGSRSWEDQMQIIQAGARARDLVDQILVFSRQDRAVPQPCLPGPIIKETLKLLRPTLPAGIVLRRNIPAQGPWVIGDPVLLHQIVTHVCVHASSLLADGGGTLTVELEQPGETDSEVELSVRVARAEKTGRTPSALLDQAAHGPDLETARELAEEAGGRLEDWERENGALRLRVFLPAAHKTARPATGAPAAVSGLDAHIMVVDDDEVVLILFSRMLEDLGYRATAFERPAEALEAFAARPEAYDLVITDQTMPEMDGSELVEGLLRLRPDLPVILCTGFSESISRERALAMGIRDYLLKPVLKKDLAAALARALKGEG